MVFISSLINKDGAQKLREEVLEHNSDRKIELTQGILRHFDSIHSIERLPIDLEIERLLLEDELKALEDDRSELNFVPGLVTFSPSSASKCERELWYKAKKVKADTCTFFPYQRRWTRNGSAVHSAVQRDLLYGEKYLDNPHFTVHRTKTGRPAWERNIQHVRQFSHKGVKFQIYGMTDGVLLYTPDNSKIGFEFKTKSTTISAVGTFKMKDAQEGHKEQCTGYSLLFGLNEFLIVYESLAKDNWTKNVEAKPDMRAFYIEVTQQDREKLLDKLASVAERVYTGELPPTTSGKCIFCPYKERCEQDIQAALGTA